MANPGVVTSIDVDALTAIIVFANGYRNLVESNAAKIKALCRSMKEDESLSGGDGDIIRDNFAKLSDGCTGLEKSMAAISKVLNEKLEAAIQMRHGATLGDSTEQATKAARNVGVLKKE